MILLVTVITDKLPLSKLIHEMIIKYWYSIGATTISGMQNIIPKIKFNSTGNRDESFSFCYDEILY